jgi:hypothetical protein
MFLIVFTFFIYSLGKDIMIYWFVGTIVGVDLQVSPPPYALIGVISSIRGQWFTPQCL